MTSTYLGTKPIRTRRTSDGNRALAVAIDGNDGSPSLKAGVTVATTPTQLVAVSSTRRSVLIVNNGTTVIFVGPNNQVGISNGIPIPQYGYFYDDSTLSAWWGVVSSSTGDARILEVT